MNFRGVLTVLLFVILNPISIVEAGVQDHRDVYREIQKIKDPDARITAELSLSVLGLPNEAPTNRMRSLEKLQALAGDSPDDYYSFRIHLSHGHSPRELAALIDAGEFQSITSVQAKFVEGELVTTLGLAAFDAYEGPTQRVLEFLLYEHREITRISNAVFNSTGVEHEQNTIAKVGNIEDVRFYVLEGVMKAGDADAMRRHHSEALMYVRINKRNLFRAAIPQFILPPKKPLPEFDIHKPAPFSIMRGPAIMKMKKAVPVSSFHGIVEPG